MVEFTTKNVVHMSTGHNAFYLSFGSHPRVPISLLHEGASSQLEAMQEMVNRMKIALEEAQANLALAQNRACEYSNRSCHTETFEVG